MVKKFHAFFETWKLIIMLTMAQRSSLPHTKLIQSVVPHFVFKIHYNIIIPAVSSAPSYESRALFFVDSRPKILGAAWSWTHSRGGGRAGSSCATSRTSGSHEGRQGCIHGETEGRTQDGISGESASGFSFLAILLFCSQHWQAYCSLSSVVLHWSIISHVKEWEQDFDVSRAGSV